MVDLTVKFLSTFKEVAGTDEMKLPVSEGFRVEGLLDLLESKGVRVKHHIQSGGSVYSTSLLIFVNGFEISVLNGLATELKNGDIVTFIPVVHGG
ncbi:MAG: MoaD family protein [Candidatus Odinarchaeum yellowstonii]|uniref:MoaD family protein n=1 Tax=Odinarchaeota yellowstonii (strain LCB_4) TaxID=1841599 RepID=A0AAF0D3U0_ODILC|nr:MAG: MoaD family protein [Candidatus Odinarchaeum yellowstonii]